MIAAKRRDAALAGELLRELLRMDMGKALLAAAMLASLSTELLAHAGTPGGDDGGDGGAGAVHDALGYLHAAAVLHPARFEPMRAQLMQSFSSAP